jgi:Tol biopolymer transport system component
MPRLATFTPEPGDADVSGRLTYVRAGRFYTADVSGGPGEVLSEDLPRVWSPPEDPGRAWASPDGTRLAFFGGADAAMWIMDRDGDNPREASGPNLPTDSFEVEAGDRSLDVRLRPGTDYTLLVLSGDDPGLAVLTDDNSRHIRGQARLRIVHAAGVHEDEPLSVIHEGSEISSAIPYGEAGANTAVYVGDIALQLVGPRDQPVANVPAFTASDRELKTLFLFGDDAVQAAQYDYQPGEPPSGHARIRVFNASNEAIDARVVGGLELATGLESGSLADYVDVPTVMSVDDRQDAELGLYGLRAGEDPVRWSQRGDKIAFVGFGDGQPDVYVADINGETRRITNDEVRELNPRWSPDGDWLLFESVDDMTDVHRINLAADDAPARALPMDAVRGAMGWSNSTLVKFPEDIDWADEDRLFFYPQADGQSGGIWTYDVDANAFDQLFPGAITDVAFSPEAGAYALVSSDAPGEVVTIDLDGTSRVVASGDAWAPVWSEDGRQISWVEGDRLSTDGWRIHAVNADGTNDRVLTDWWPILQEEPPVPGPDAKRVWLDDGNTLAFTRAGQDYGAAERSGLGGATAGDDIENVWMVATDGSEPPEQATDLTRVFYLRGPEESPDGDTLALVGFSYRDRVQWLWTFPADGGKPTKIDGGVRWYVWDR